MLRSHPVRLRLRDLCARQDVSLDLLHRASRLPLRLLVALMQDDPPREIRLAVIARLARTLSVEPSALFANLPTGLYVEVGLSVDGSAAEPTGCNADSLADLEAEWRAEGGDARRRTTSTGS